MPNQNIVVQLQTMLSVSLNKSADSSGYNKEERLLQAQLAAQYAIALAALNPSEVAHDPLIIDPPAEGARVMAKHSTEELQRDDLDLFAVTDPDELSYLVRRYSHETGVRVGSCSTHEDTLRAVVGLLMSIKATERQRRERGQ